MIGMSSEDIGLKVSVQGEKLFKQSLQEINAALRVNNAELEAVSAAYKGNENSIDALTAKQDALDRSILTQTDKVRALETALSESANKYGEADRRTLRYQEQLLKAQAALDKTRYTLSETSDALENVKDGTDESSASFSDLAEKLGVDLPPALSSAIDGLDGVNKSGLALVGVLGGIVTGLAKATISTAETSKELETLSSVTGFSVEALQELDYAGTALGVESDQITDSMKDLTSAMRDARGGSEDMQSAFDTLGVKVSKNNGDLRSANEVYFEVIDALGQVRNETERDALAMQIFGEEAQKLNPLIEAGIDTLGGLAQEANNLGYVMDTETVSKFSDLQDSLGQLEKQSEAVKNSFAVALLPVLTSLFETVSNIPTPVLQMIITLAGIVTTIVLVVKSIKEMTSTASTIKGFFDTFDKSSLKTTAIILGVVAALIALAAIIAVIMGKSGELNATMSSIGDTIGGIQGQVQTAQNSYSQIPRYARGTSYHPGGLAVVGENGPELVSLPRGSQVYPNGQTPGGSNTYYITIDAKNVKEFNDIVKIVQEQRRRNVQFGRR